MNQSKKMIYRFLIEDQNGVAAEDQTNDYDQIEKYSEEDLEKSKKIAAEFTTAFHNYNSDKPMEYLENAKPYMTKIYMKK